MPPIKRVGHTHAVLGEPSGDRSHPGRARLFDASAVLLGSRLKRMAAAKRLPDLHTVRARKLT